jgi:hypothetical protein
VYGLEAWRASALDRLVPKGSRVISTHKSLDGDHVGPCLTYIERYCRSCRRDLAWSVEFVGRCLREGQVYLAHDALGRLA